MRRFDPSEAVELQDASSSGHFGWFRLCSHAVCFMVAFGAGSDDEHVAMFGVFSQYLGPIRLVLGVMVTTRLHIFLVKRSDSLLCTFEESQKSAGVCKFLVLLIRGLPRMRGGSSCL